MKSFLKDIVCAILGFEARIILKKYKPKIIAITGSVGKTSTKDAIYSVLKEKSFIRKSEKSFNSEIGIPLTILGVQNGWSDPVLWLKNISHGLELIFFNVKYPECLVLEVGADKPGDIKKVTEWLKPDITVITKIGDVPAHVEFYSSSDEVVKEKSYLAKALKKNGTLILSGDDVRVREMGKGMTQKIMTFGMNTKTDVGISHDSIVCENQIPVGMNFKLNFEGNSIPVIVRGFVGKHLLYPLVAAATVGITYKISLLDIANNLAKHVPSKGRMNILKGINGSIIIDDTYNSSPDALHEALNALDKVEIDPSIGSKKIAIIGDMLELGKFSNEEHEKAGEHALVITPTVITVGQRASHIPNMLKSFDSSNEAIPFIKEIVGKGDVVLVKGSQSIRMEKIVKALLLEPERSAELLVRQDPEWLAKE